MDMGAGVAGWTDDYWPGTGFRQLPRVPCREDQEVVFAYTTVSKLILEDAVSLEALAKIMARDLEKEIYEGLKRVRDARNPITMKVSE